VWDRLYHKFTTGKATVQNKSILLIIGGGIAAYKSLDLIRRCRERGARVRAVLTNAAQEFVTPLSVSALAEERAFTNLFDLKDESEIGHIRLSREADLIIIAPATADLLARMAAGLANDLASAVLLAADKPILVAPAMNWRMWSHPATQDNAARLKSRGVRFIGPNEGAMACGESGWGRMAEPQEILAAAEQILRGEAEAGLLAGAHVVVTAGPTCEPIDPVRYIANRSSGKQGYAIAAAAARFGARVTLISGPVAIAAPSGVDLVRVETALEMLAAVEASMPADIAVFAAAVADWRPEQAAADKVKKNADGEPPVLRLVENPDIARTIGLRQEGRPGLVIGFAAETQNFIANAQAKLASKGCDWIAANDVSPAGGVMGGERNQISLVTADGVDVWSDMSKKEAAEKLIRKAALRCARPS
jgi:phosphopantothenoylcysteine decarboxylase / phosphopantothenate---cysteine ligase